MKYILLLFFVSFGTISNAQEDQRLTTIQIVEVIDNNIDEAIYYYENNWKVLREMALKKEYIDSYQLLISPESDQSKTEIVLFTTFKNSTQYELREEHFQELIKEKGELRLLNDKKPGEFRKSLMIRDQVRHLK